MGAGPRAGVAEGLVSSVNWSQEGRRIERNMGEEKWRPKAFLRSGFAGWGSKETGRGGERHSRPDVGGILINNPGRCLWRKL